jgi:hypothetical protein
MRIPNLQSIGCRPIRHDVAEFAAIPPDLPSTPRRLLEAVVKKFKTSFPEIKFTVAPQVPIRVA